jgi:signal recognition particle subunit SRP19
MEIRDVLMSAGYQPIVENKQYPRERSREFEFRGRIRVQLKNDDGSPHLEKFQTRESIMEHLGNFLNEIVDESNWQKGQRKLIFVIEFQTAR